MRLKKGKNWIHDIVLKAHFYGNKERLQPWGGDCKLQFAPYLIVILGIRIAIEWNSDGGGDKDSG